jgi:hypothetical protein
MWCLNRREKASLVLRLADRLLLPGRSLIVPRRNFLVSVETKGFPGPELCGVELALIATTRRSASEDRKTPCVACQRD